MIDEEIDRLRLADGPIAYPGRTVWYVCIYDMLTDNNPEPVTIYALLEDQEVILSERRYETGYDYTEDGNTELLRDLYSSKEAALEGCKERRAALR